MFYLLGLQICFDLLENEKSYFIKVFYILWLKFTYFFQNEIRRIATIKVELDNFFPNLW